MWIVFGWPFLLAFGVLWLTWQGLRLTCWMFYYIGVFILCFVLPAVVYLIALVSFALVRWAFPRLRKNPEPKEIVPPVWRGWTPPKS